MNSWKIDVEESQRVMETHGILCLVSVDGKKRLYVKPVSHEGDFVELKPLTTQELAELKIEVNESCMNAEFDIDVEESSSETDPEKRKTFNLSDPEDMKKAKEIADKALERLREKDPENWNLNSQESETNGSSTEQKIADSVRRQITEKYAELGHTPPSLETKEDMDSATEILKALQEKNKEIIKLREERGEPSGNAPLNRQQLFGMNKNQGFDSVERMIDDLRKREREGDQEAKIILDKLTLKTFKGSKDVPMIDFSNVNPKAREDNPNARAIEVPMNATNPNNEPSELKKFGIGLTRKEKEEKKVE